MKNSHKNSYAIKVEHLSKYFYLSKERSSSVRDYIINFFKLTKKKKFTALDDISFTVKHGESLGIIGPNGSGKSTLLKILSGIYHPSKGSLKTKGRVISFLELGVGFNEELTGRENIYLNGILIGMRRDYITEHFIKIVEYSGIDKQFLDTPLKYYSSGMKLRLAFAVAIHAEAEIYIMDEVLAVGDSQFQEKCKTSFESIIAAGKTILIVSHNMSYIGQFCSKVLLIENGSIKNFGNPNDIIFQYSTKHNRNRSKYVKNVGLTNATGKLQKIYSVDDVINIEFEVSSIVINKNYYLGLSIKGPNDNTVFDAHMLIDNCKPINKKKYSLTILNHHLRQGSYSIDVTICKGSLTKRVEFIRSAAEFEIIKTIHSAYRGVIDMTYNWR